MQKLHFYWPQRSREKCSWRISLLLSAQLPNYPVAERLPRQITHCLARFVSPPPLRCSLFAGGPPSCLWPWHWQRNAHSLIVLQQKSAASSAAFTRGDAPEEWWWIFNWHRPIVRPLPLLLRLDLSPLSVTLRVKNVRGWRVRRKDGHADQAHPQSTI
jgi:hypothetical protein